MNNNEALTPAQQDEPAEPITLTIDSALQAALARYREVYQLWWVCPREQAEKSAELRKDVDEAADVVARALSAQMDSALDSRN